MKQQARRGRGAAAAVSARRRAGPEVEKNSEGIRFGRGPPTFPSSIHFSSIQPNKKLDNGNHILFFNQTPKMVIPNQVVGDILIP
jgi:hypothetical protein